MHSAQRLMLEEVGSHYRFSYVAQTGRRYAFDVHGEFYEIFEISSAHSSYFGDTVEKINDNLYRTHTMINVYALRSDLRDSELTFRLRSNRDPNSFYEKHQFLRAFPNLRKAMQFAESHAVSYEQLLNLEIPKTS